MDAGCVIVVSYNSELCIEACLNALLQAGNWNIILVDNASEDHTLQKARGFEPKVRILSNSENKGFAAAVNQGIRASQADIYIVLNPDVISSPQALQKLAEALGGEHTGAAGGNLVRDGSPQKGFAMRRLPTLASAVAEVLLLNRLWPGNRWNRHYRCLDVDYNILQEIEQPPGACLAVKRLAWEELDGLDEDFFPVWFEDVDFCRRLRNRGWKIMYCPEAVFLHSGGHSVNRLSFADRQSYWYANQLHYFSKHHSAAEVRLLRVANATGLVLRSVLSCFGLCPQGTSLRQAVCGYWRAARQCAFPGCERQFTSKSKGTTSGKSAR